MLLAFQLGSLQNEVGASCPEAASRSTGSGGCMESGLIADEWDDLLGIKQGKVSEVV